MVTFDSRDKQYKDPVGAISSESSVRFCISISPEVAVREVHLAMESDGRSERTYQMVQSADGRYELTLTMQDSGLYFYRFEVVKEDGNFLFVGRGEGGKAVVGDWLPRWKMTVYDKNFTVADKWKGGVMYQIFPDRFARVSDKAPDVQAPGERYFRKDVSARPYDYTDPAHPGGKDYYGGSIEGVRQKLPYLKDLGVTVIYFNPVFESGENHRYSTADYKRIDPWFGTEAEFVAFCKEAKDYGIEVILDGVFSHTGADSVYFNKEGYYDSVGAYNSKESPYYSWYQFEQYPDKYKGWWGFKNLPNVNETAPEYLDFITGKEGVLAYWQQRGAAGWRLDVADELPDAFLEALRERVKAQDPESYIVGEVWEHAVEKISYGARRQFLLGKQCDSVMNYPWREAIIQLVKTGNLSAFAESVQTVWEDYPRPSLDTLMNILSTHDTVRILTELGSASLPTKRQGVNDMSEPQRESALGKLRFAAMLQFTLPGIPCIYYGDEIGTEGFVDPYCRSFFDWSRTESDIHGYYQMLGQLRRDHRADFAGDFVWLEQKDGMARYRRGRHIEVVINISHPPIKGEGKLLLSSCKGELLLPGNAAIYYNC